MLDSGPAILAAVSELSVPVGVLVFAALLATAVLITFLTDRVQVPFTLVLVLVGFGGSEIAKWQGLDIELEGDTFQQVVLFGFLPVLVYASAREISARLFIRNLLPILTLAIPAYLVSAVLVAGGLSVDFYPEKSGDPAGIRRLAFAVEVGRPASRRVVVLREQ